MDKTKMTKDELKIELEAAKLEIEQLEKEKTELARCFSAVTSARASALEQKDSASYSEEPEDLHAFAFQDGAADILSRLFLFDDCGECIGFNLDEVEYYCWLAADPRRKKAAPL
ncbi:MAG: hypothetical protein ACLUHK_03360 [Eubacteriales bacterium]